MKAISLLRTSTCTHRTDATADLSRRPTRSRNPVALLLTVVVMLVGSPAWAGPADPAGGLVHPEWGSTSAPNGVLRDGCHTHPYRYALTPPEGDWQLETFIYGPGKRQVASGWFIGGDDHLAEATTFQLCRADNRPGRYRITALLSVENGPNGYVQGWLPTTHFRLRVPHRH